MSVAAGVNALWAAAWSLVPILVTVAVVTLVGSPRPPVTTTLRYGMAAWLLGHGVPLRLDGQPITLVPLAVTALAIWRCVRAGRNTTRALGVRRARSVRPAVVVAASVAIPYGLLGAAAAALVRGRGLEVSILRAGLTLGGLALVAAFFGAWPRSGFARRLRARIPYAVRDGVRTAIVSVSFLLAAGAIAVGVQIAVAGATATSILRNMHLGFAGDLGIVLVCLAYAPNLAVWASAYLAGPGFTLGQVPELPVFAGLPDRAITGVGQILLATPVIAGLVAGVLLARRSRADSDRPVSSGRPGRRHTPRCSGRGDRARRHRICRRRRVGRRRAREHRSGRLGVRIDRRARHRHRRPGRCTGRGDERLVLDVGPGPDGRVDGGWPAFRL